MCIRDSLEHAQDDPSITDITTLYDLGFAELTQKQKQRFGPYLPILTYEGDIETTLGIHTSEGRLPENENEILLFDGWQSSQGVNIGDKVTLQAVSYTHLARCHHYAGGILPLCCDLRIQPPQAASDRSGTRG